MSAGHHRNLSRSCLALLFFSVSLLFLSAAGVQAAPADTKILVLNSYNDGYDWSDAEMQGLRDALAKRLSSRVEILVEHLDTKRFHDQEHFPQLATMFASKYRKLPFQLVIAMDNAALEFALRYRDLLYRDIPLVFCGINNYQPGMIAGQRKITGVAEFHDSWGTVQMALKLHPSTREIVVIHDYTGTGLAMRGQLEKSAAGSPVQLRFLDEMPLELAAQQLRKLPRHTLVLLLSYTVEKGRRSFSQSEVGRLIASISPVPVYAVHAAQLGQGVVGGRMMAGRAQGEKAAELAVRILSGEAAEKIPVFTGNLSEAMFDDTVLRRFEIDRDKLPADAVLVNRPASFYAVNKKAFWVALLLTVVMVAAILVLYLSYERRKQLEKALRMTEAKFKQLFDSAGDAIYIHDFNFNILEVNQAACDLMGYRHEEMRGLNLRDINAPEQKSRLSERLADVQRDGRALYESMHQTRSGELLPIEVSGRLIEYEEGPAILSVVRDISKRKSIEVREQTRLKILEEMATGSGLEELLNYIVRFVEQESPGALCSVLLADDTGSRLRRGAAPSLPDFYNQAVDGLKIKNGMGSCGTAAFLKQRVIVEDIEKHPFWKGFQPARQAGLRACWSEPVLSVHGELLGTFAIYYRTCRSPREEELALIESAAHMASIAIGRVRSDESRSRLEEQMRQMQKIEAIGQLAGGLAHDFNNLLTPIFVYADIAKRSLSDEDPNRKKLDGILMSAHKAADLTKKLLSFGRKQMLTMEALDLNDVIVSLLDLMQRTIRANIEIKTNLTHYGAQIFADRGQIEQILINFAVNAQDAIKGNGSIVMETGNLMIDDEFVKLNPGTKTGPHVLLSFSDNGCGMSEEVLGHIFEPFFTTKPVGQGTGLGLATVYGIVKQHNGFIKVMSQVGKGTSLLLYFPRSSGNARPEPVLPLAADRTVGRDTRATILVVDDNESIRELAVELLQSSGYHVLLAETPARAQQLAQSEGVSVDLLVTDVVMPEMSGPELYELLVLRHPRLPVLYISGYTFDVKVHNPSQHRRVSFLPKPFTSEQFLAGIEKALSVAASS